MPHLPKLEVLAMKDDASKIRVKKRSTFDLPMRLLVVGKSAYSGKTNLTGNILMRPFDQEDESGSQFYKNDFEGYNIYVVSPSTLVDHKWRSIIKGKDIPESNIYNRYDEEELERLYDKLENDYYEELGEGEIPKPKLVIFDDVSFNGDFKSKVNGIMSKFFCNGRHFNISLIVLSQKLSDLSTVMRENMTGLCMFACSNKQAELLYNDVGTTDKKTFMNMLKKATHAKHSFMVVNYSNEPEERFLNQNFQLIE